MEFDESKHPRDGDGKFTDGASDKLSEAERIYNSDSPPVSSEDADTVSDSLEDLLGEEFKDVKGQEAVEKLLREKRGHVKGAFHREDIGDIDLLWGNDTLGLQHIVKQREAQGINVEDFLKGLSEVIENGEFYQKSERGNFEFIHNGKMAVIAPEYHGKKLTFVLTAYKTRKKAPPKGNA